MHHHRFNDVITKATKTSATIRYDDNEIEKNVKLQFIQKIE
jgi:hypothetical protein